MTVHVVSVYMYILYIYGEGIYAQYTRDGECSI